MEEFGFILIPKDNKKVIHRVVDIISVNSNVRYYTKGDANDNNDEGYITSNEIKGLYKFKIKYIGYPTIWIRDIFFNK